MESSATNSCRGRPRSFNGEEALDKAMHVFWQKGYSEASIADLTKAMGINAPSLYAAFGNKEALFRKVLQRYGEGPAAKAVAALEAPTARAVAEARLQATVEMVSGDCHPQACLISKAIATCGDKGEAIRRDLLDYQSTALRQRFERAQSEGDLAATVDAGVLAGYLTAICQGIAFIAETGASRRELEEVAAMAMTAWPE